jgi:hypothetical protein
MPAAAEDPVELWVYSVAGVNRLADRTAWDRIFSTMVESGWTAPSEREAGWLESPLVPYRPGSFFTAADAASFADALEALSGTSEFTAGKELIRRLGELFRQGSVFLWSESPSRTLGTGAMEVVHVYLCAKCGFMHHGRWFFDHADDPSDIRRSVTSALEHKYCPLCSSKRIYSQAFFLPEIDPNAIEYLPCFLWRDGENRITGEGLDDQEE